MKKNFNAIISFVLVFCAIATICSCSKVDEKSEVFTSADGIKHTVKSLSVGKDLTHGFQKNTLEIQHKRVDDITLYEVFSKEKSNKLIVFIHSSDSQKEEFIPEMEGIASSGYYCVAFDVNGYGERKNSTKNPAIKLVVDAVKDVDVLLDYYIDYMKLSSFGLEGFSLGGGIIYQYCVDGKRTPKAVAVGSSSPELSAQPNYTVVNGQHIDSIWSKKQFEEYAQLHSPMNKIEKFKDLAIIAGHCTKDPIVSVEGEKKLEKYLFDNGNDKAIFHFYDSNNHDVPEKFVYQILPFMNRSFNR